MQQNLTNLLAALTGNLYANNKKEAEEIEALQDLLAQTLPRQDETTLSNQSFSFQSTDFFSTQKIPETKLDAIDKKATQAIETKATNNLKVFVRETPVRSSQIAGSIPEWAVGARVTNTLGPFTGRDGIKRWFDFFTVEKLVAIYFQGQTLPAVLFKATFLVPDIVGPQRPPEITNKYTLIPGSIWINARLLSSAAPADRYCGLRVKSGTISLSEMPQMVGTLLTVPAASTIQVNIILEQAMPDLTTATDEHGADARALKLSLPTQLTIGFTSVVNHIFSVDPLSWVIYGQEGESKWNGDQNLGYDASISKLLIPQAIALPEFSIKSCKSPFQTISGNSVIKNAWWGIATAAIDISNPLEAEGNGSVVLKLDKGLSCSRFPVIGTEMLLPAPLLIAEPGRIGITEMKSNGLGSTQQLNLWKDEINPHGTSALFTFLKEALFIYNTTSKGDELLLVICDAQVFTDRPVKVNGEALEVRTKKSTSLFSANAITKRVILYDDNILLDNNPSVTGTVVIPAKPISIALENALFTTTPVNGCMLNADCTPDWKKALVVKTFITVGLYAYLPTLPDPYAANVSTLAWQYDPAINATGAMLQRMWLWLVCRISSKPNTAAENLPGFDTVTTSFHLGNLPFDFGETASKNQSAANTGFSIPAETALFKVASINTANENTAAAMLEKTETDSGLNKAFATDIDYEKIWQGKFGSLLTDSFALLDVSSNANQMGISFGLFNQQRWAMVPTATVVPRADANALPFMVNEMSVQAPGVNVRAFVLPQFAWEPLFNLSYQTTPPPPAMDPLPGFNYYPNDGGPTRIFSINTNPVALSPIPLVKYIIDEFKNNPAAFTLAAFTLPFGLRAMAMLNKKGVETIKPTLENNRVNFKTGNSIQLTAGIQISAKAGNYGKAGASPAEHDSPMFPGYIMQVNNVLDFDGTANGRSTLGATVTNTFNNEFYNFPMSDPSGVTRGVPVSRIDFSGYGASIFSNWVSPTAAIAQTSQARFDAMMGRTGHEVIQIKSILYPWGIRVVRTITLHRESSGFIYRKDSGWIAESDGLFDFRYTYKNAALVDVKAVPYTIHPGVLQGLFNIKNIAEDGNIDPFTAKNNYAINDLYINSLGVQQAAVAAFSTDVICQAVWFDADIAIENMVQGKQTIKDKTGNNRSVTPSKKILGYVQVAPAGTPLTPVQFRDLINQQNGSIGGAISCQVDINLSNQNMRLNRFDMSPSIKANGDIIFVATARGNVVLPKDGSWSIVQHAAQSGEITPLSEGLTVPLIREGEWVPEKVIDEAAAKLKLIRMAHPMEILRNVAADTINFGLLQNMGTQKALFLTPAFKNLTTTLLSKTPPLFADAYRMMTGKGIFPNIGNGITDFGKAFSLQQGLDGAGNVVANAFAIDGIKDGASDVFKLLQIDAVKQGEAAIEQGMQLLKGAAAGAIDKALQFDLPDLDIPLIEMEGLKIYIEYKTSTLDKSAPKNDMAGTKKPGKLNFDIASKIGAAATDAAETWKSRLNNMSMVIDLGSFERLMRIKGNFDSKKGQAAGYSGGTASAGAAPEIEFHPSLQPIIDLLQVLSDLSVGNYGAALKKGLKIAMGNAGEIWEYKFEATKEIPLVRFPPEKNLYENPTTPLKLEASMALGVYFNSALKVTTDASQLLPTAGAFLKFHGGMSVMCFSLGVGTIYAIGSVDVRIACDTAVGPNLTLKFGFGASIAVGLPVVGTATVTFMVGVEMYMDSKEISISAFMYFRGNAELLAGLVSVTITIEAKGTIKRTADRTECAAQVTFAIDISIFLIIDISFSETWGEQRQIA